MGTRADFYVEKYDRLLWVGSLYKNGDPTNIPSEILIQVNSAMYEELVVEFLETKESSIRSNGDKWPWPWACSKMTDYAYIFKKGMDKVIAYSMDNAGEIFDPLKIKQGEDISTSYIPFVVSFPLMNKKAKVITTEEMLNINGYQPSKAV